MNSSAEIALPTRRLKMDSIWRKQLDPVGLRKHASTCPLVFLPDRKRRDLRPTCRARHEQSTEQTRRGLMLSGAGLATTAKLWPAQSGADLTSIMPIETTELGKTGLMVSSGGIGAWSWGDRSGYWGYNNGYTRDDNAQAYRALAERGLSLVDTAEVYGFGLSEEILGAAIKETGLRPFIATKFAPLPWRFSSESVVKALRGSLQRLQVPQIGLYQIHWPGFLTQAFSNDAFVLGLARCAQQGLTQAVGVSNFRADRVRTAASILEGEGQQLASNQVQYSLAYRVPESNGVLQATRESGATLIAYSPLCQGLLTGKYTVDNLPSGPRSAVINADRLREVEPLLTVMRDISAKRGKSLAQIAINWTLCKGALPIPGAKNVKQVNEAAGAFGWRLDGDEVSELDGESAKIRPSLANPVENY